MDKIVVTQGLQYGSEAKGSIAAAVARGWNPDTVATAWGPNAGHTVRDRESGIDKFASSMLASSALYPSVETILVGPGSVLDITKLTAEIDLAGSRLEGKLLVIHPNAPVLQPGHAEAERGLLRIGSTMKGTAEAAIGKIRRQELAIAGSLREPFGNLLLVASKHRLMVSFSAREYDRCIDKSRRLIVEGAQGFSLGFHGPFYPYCTSRDVSTNQVLADCRIPVPYGEQGICIIGVCRTYPIRVANRKSEDGQDFTSGGFYEDQHELDWANDLGREPELTTVTKLPRRIFSFSHEQIAEAVRIMRPTLIALTFCDYLDEHPESRDGKLGGVPKMGAAVQALKQAIENTTTGMGPRVPVDSVSYGPDVADIFNVPGVEDHLDDDLFKLES